MTLAEEWAFYAARNARANRAYLVDTCTGCGDLWPWNGAHADDWMCERCRRKEARKTA